MNGNDIRLGYTNLRGILDSKWTIRFESISDILISMFSGINKCSQGRNIFVIDFGLPRYQKFVISLICVSAEFPTYNDDAHFPNREATFYDFGDEPEREWLINSLMNHKFTGNSIQFNVLWEMGETTWEPLAHCKELAALDHYLELHGVTKWQDLPRTTQKRNCDNVTPT